MSPSTRDVGRLMRLFHGTIEALETAQEEQRDGFAVVDEAVGWAKLLRVRGEVRTLADLAEEDPLLGAADRYRTLRKFAPDLLEALEFKAARSHDPTPVRDQAAAGSQPLGQARRAGGRAHAVPQGMEAAGHRGRTAKSAPL